MSELIIFLSIAAVSGIGALVADFILPRIPFVQRYLESLPDFDD